MATRTIQVDLEALRAKVPPLEELSITARAGVHWAHLMLHGTAYAFSGASLEEVLTKTAQLLQTMGFEINAADLVNKKVGADKEALSISPPAWPPIQPQASIANFLQKPGRPITAQNADQLRLLLALPCLQNGGLAWAPDDTALATASGHTIVIYTAAGSFELPGHTDYIARLAFSPDGQHLASASYDGTVCVWHLPTRTTITAFAQHRDMVADVAFHPSGDLLASVGTWDRSVLVWEAKTGHVVFEGEGDSSSAGVVAISPDGNFLVAAGIDGQIRVWTYPYQGEPQLLEGHTDYIMGLTFTPDSKLLASTGVDDTVRFWEIGEGSCLRMQTLGEPGLALTYHPYAGFLACGLWSNVELRSHNLERTLATLDHGAHGVGTLAFSHAGTYLATLTEGGVDVQSQYVCLWGVA